MQVPDLYVIGLGVQIPGQITQQARRALSQSERVYAIVQEQPSIWLPPERANVHVVNLLQMYAEGELRTYNYERAAQMVIEGVKEVRPVAYVTYGNPLVYDSVGQSIVHQAKRYGVPFAAVPGISSLETILCDLGVDMAPGIQIHEASWLLAARVPLWPNAASLVLQIGMFGSMRAHCRTLPDPASLNGLVSYLRQWYPQSHKVFLVRSAGREGESARVRELPLGELSRARVEDITNASMYIPALADPELDGKVIGEMASR